jgi:uncharacterized protein (TIGR02594 family)
MPVIGTAAAAGAKIGRTVGRGGDNHRNDVETVQKLLNANAEALGLTELLVEDGKVGRKTIAAIEAFQKKVLGFRHPDGRIHPNGLVWSALVDTALHKLNELSAPWIELARQECGEKEVKGTLKNNSRIVEYLNTFEKLRTGYVSKKHNLTAADVDETAWCSAFINWCLIKAGKPAGISALAASWLDYGTKLDSPRLGAITVIYTTPKKSVSGTTTTGNHVGFYTGRNDRGIVLLGGNQGDRVSESAFGKGWTIKGYRWPS